MPSYSPKVKVLGIIFSNDFATRFYAKYFTRYSNLNFQKLEYDLSNHEGQKKFEKTLVNKFKKMNVKAVMNDESTEIFAFNGITALFKILGQLHVYVICEDDQNYVLMENVINCICEVLRMTTTQVFSGKMIYQHLSDLISITDQVVDQGLLIELNPEVVFNRIRMKDQASPVKRPSQPQEPGKFASLFGMAKNSLSKTLNLG